MILLKCNLVLARSLSYNIRTKLSDEAVLSLQKFPTSEAHDPKLSNRFNEG